MRTILVLGSGLMAESVITYLLSNPKNRIHIASNILPDAKKIAQKKGLDRCTYSEVAVEDAKSLKPLIYTSDVVISYVPAFLHIHVAKACIEVGRHLVTASYISNQMMALDTQVKKKGLIFLNELGLDPGIDHLTTMKTIQEVKEKGGKIIEYQSWCGGLPSPANCDNPLGYKFTWSPIGAFRALKNKAVFVEGGKQVQIQPSDLLYKITQVQLNKALLLQGYPNRDSVSYREVYGLFDARKVLRGTLRYKGFTELINAFKQIGYFDQKSVSGSTWLQYTQILVKSQKGSTLQHKILNRTVHNVKHYQLLSKQQKQIKGKRIINSLRYFDFLSPIKFFDPKLTNLQNLIKLIEPKLSLKAGQTDLVAMQHRFVIQVQGKKIRRKSSLIQIGQRNGFTAMSITVGFPSAIGAELILDGKISQRGVIRPIYKDIYEPTLHLLEKVGIRLVEQDQQVHQ